MITNVVILVAILGIGSSQTMTITPMSDMEACKSMAAQLKAELPNSWANPLTIKCLESKP